MIVENPLPAVSRHIWYGIRIYLCSAKYDLYILINRTQSILILIMLEKAKHSEKMTFEIFHQHTFVMVLAVLHMIYKFWNTPYNMQKLFQLKNE